jgi:hypothetical protein
MAPERTVGERLAVLETLMDGVIEGQERIRKGQRQMLCLLLALAGALKMTPDLAPLLLSLF